MTPADLLAFEEDIAQEFASGKIRAPIHLGGGNEVELIEVFNNLVKPGDWVLAGWRSHYHCLLKGVPPEKLKARIMAGHSVGLCFPEHKILCSGIVGGIAPIAVGIARALKWRGDLDPTGNGTKVIAFIGDMTAESGIVTEAIRYGTRHSLPVFWVIEDNGLSVCTNTQESWGPYGFEPDVISYEYKLTRPHAGIGKWVRF